MGVVILTALYRAGVVLPDCDSSRFLVDEGGRLWLFDLRGVRDGREDPLRLARDWCQRTLARREDLLARLSDPETVEELARALC